MLSFPKGFSVAAEDFSVAAEGLSVLLPDFLDETQAKNTADDSNKTVVSKHL